MEDVKRITDFPGILKTGDFALFGKTLNEGDVTLYAGISADFSPIHMNEEYAVHTKFEKRVVHPMLLTAMVDGAIYRLLHHNAYSLKREFEVYLPVYIGETVTARAEILNIDENGKKMTIEFGVYNQNRELVLGGTSVEDTDIFYRE